MTQQEPMQQGDAQVIPTQHGPAMPPPKKSGLPGWVAGCGIGCGLAVLAGIVGIVLFGGLGYFAARRMMEESKYEVIAELKDEYDEYAGRDVIPDEHRPLFEELRDLGTDEASSFPAILMCYIAISATLEDGQVTEQEARLLSDVRDFVKTNPQVGLIGMGTFIAEHPELQGAFEEAQEEFGVPSERDKMDDAPEPAGAGA